MEEGLDEIVVSESYIEAIKEILAIDQSKG
jgi:hypothetical protein